MFLSFYLMVTVELNLCGFYILFFQLDHKLDVMDYSYNSSLSSNYI